MPCRASGEATASETCDGDGWNRCSTGTMSCPTRRCSRPASPAADRPRRWTEGSGTTHQSETSHVERTVNFLQRVRALIVVGSVARGEARPDSDVDVVLLTTDPARYLENVDWVTEFGAAERVELEKYGKVTSVRATYRDSLEVEFAVSAVDWASAPFRSTQGPRRWHGMASCCVGPRRGCHGAGRCVWVRLTCR
jgi:predicted nucleotidyltransferase